MSLRISQNIVNNLGKIRYLSTVDTDHVPEPLKDGFSLAHQTFSDGGTCLEFGVSQGNSWMWQVLQILNRYSSDVLIGFDSWQGLPEETPGVWAPHRHRKGAFATSKDIVLQRMKEVGASLGSQFKFVDGYFSDSLTSKLRSKISNLIFVNIDVDLHSSTMEVLQWIQPLLQTGTVIYFDDWLDPSDIGKGAQKWGEHLAFEQWLKQSSSIKVELIALNDANQRAYQIIS